jgi:aspartate/methionine/tyrosine aminotransferase
MFSQRLAFAATPNALSKAKAKRLSANLPVLDMADSNPASAGFGWSVAELGSFLRKEGLQRQEPDPRGLATARTAISDYYSARGVRVSADRLFLSASTSEGYSWLFKLLCDPGDEVLVPEPAYPLLEVLASLEGVSLRPYKLTQLAGEWVIDPAQLKAGSRTKAIVCINPSNPTGAYVGKRDRDLLRSFALKHGLAILCDEVFLDYPAAGSSAAGSWADETQVALYVLSGLSKVAVAPQLKVGWIAVAGPANHALESCRRLEHIADAFLSVNTGAQLALPDLLRRAEPLRAAIRARVAQNETTLKAWVAASGHPCTVLPRPSGWMGILGLPPGVSEERLLLNALDEGIWAHPGYFYGMPATSGSLILSLLLDPKAFSEGLQGLDRALRRS